MRLKRLEGKVSFIEAFIEKDKGNKNSFLNYLTKLSSDNLTLILYILRNISSGHIPVKKSVKEASYFPNIARLKNYATKYQKWARTKKIQYITLFFGNFAQIFHYLLFLPCGDPNDAPELSTA